MPRTSAQSQSGKGGCSVIPPLTSGAQRAQILELLQIRGKEGASNFELMKIGARYSARIFELRHDFGWDIRRTKVDDQEFRFVLHGTPEGRVSTSACGVSYGAPGNRLPVGTNLHQTPRRSETLPSQAKDSERLRRDYVHQCELEFLSHCFELE